MSKPRQRMSIAGAGRFSQAAEANNLTPTATAIKPPASRVGRVALPFWVPPAARVQLKHMVTDMHLTAQDAMTEALNDWFKKNGKPPIA